MSINVRTTQLFLVIPNEIPKKQMVVCDRGL